MNEEKKKDTKEPPKLETPQRINIATPRPSDKKALNNSMEGKIQHNYNSEDDE
jgi:hypothetical protein